MTKRTQAIEKMPTIAYASTCNGVEIKKIDYGIEDYVICISNAWNDRQNLKAHRLKIYYTDRPYFRLHGYRIYLDECIRTIHT